MVESIHDLLIRVANDLVGCADQLDRIALSRSESERYTITAERDHIHCSVELLRNAAETLPKEVA